MIKLEHFQQALEYSKARLPVVGILAFSLCSVNALYNLFISNATHSIKVFWFAAVLCELVTAWLVGQTVNTLRRVTQSNLSKQDRKFYTILLVLFIILAVPSLALSVWANFIEFGRNLALGLAFPGLSVACAVGAALPGVSAKYEQGKAIERAEQARLKAERARERAEREQARIRAETEQARLAAEQEQRRIIEQQNADRERAEREQRRIIEQQNADRERAEREQRDAERRQAYNSLSANARQIVDSLATDGQQTQASLASALAVTPQTVAHHIGRLTDLGLLKKNGAGYKVLVEVERTK